MIMKTRVISRVNTPQILCFALFALVLFFGAMAGSAQAPSHGVVRPLAGAKFEADESIKCLAGVLENGDPDAGASTFLLKATSKCVVPPHFHTAEEQLIVVSGEVSTGMEGMSDTVLTAGGFAMMPGKKAHWFSCVSKAECLMFVTFDRKYDVVWIRPQ
jgi:quercetin dioxygenase-like cupin family protein